MENKQAFPRQQWEYDGKGNVLQYQEEGCHCATTLLLKHCRLYQCLKDINTTLQKYTRVSQRMPIKWPMQCCWQGMVIK